MESGRPPVSPNTDQKIRKIVAREGLIFIGFVALFIIGLSTSKDVILWAAVAYFFYGIICFVMWALKLLFSEKAVFFFFGFLLLLIWFALVVDYFTYRAEMRGPEPIYTDSAERAVDDFVRKSAQEIEQARASGDYRRARRIQSQLGQITDSRRNREFDNR